MCAAPCGQANFVDDFKQLPGFKDILAVKVYNNIHTVINVPIDIELLMSSSFILIILIPTLFKIFSDTIGIMGYK